MTDVFAGHGGRTRDLDGDEDDGKEHNPPLLGVYVSTTNHEYVQAMMKSYIPSTIKSQATLSTMICMPSCKSTGTKLRYQISSIYQIGTLTTSNRVRPLRPGVRLTAIFDSCHSGTALDLPYVYSTQGVLKEPNLAKEAAQDLFSAFMSYGNGDMRSVASTAIGLFKKITVSDSARQKTLATRTAPADVIMFSGSKDTQTS